MLKTVVLLNMFVQTMVKHVQDSFISRKWTAYLKSFICIDPKLWNGSVNEWSAMIPVNNLRFLIEEEF